MKALRQFVVFLVVLAGGLYIWIAYVPEARGMLERTGLIEWLGIELPEMAAEEEAPQRRGGGATQVITETAVERAIADRITSIGDGRALRSVTVRSNAAGIVIELPVQSGVRVEAGEIIARLQDEAEEIALEQTQIMLDEARYEEQRLKQLLSVGAATEVRLRETETALRNAELALREAQFNLSQREITAPMSGWVGIIEIEQGDRVNSQDVIATITDRTEILIDFRVPERVVAKIAQGQPVEVMPLALRDVVLEGEIATIDPVVDRASRTLLVRARVRNTNDLLRAGMAFSVSMTFPGETLLSIAPLAVQWSSDGPFVWVVREGKAMQMPVTIAQRNSDSVLVTSDDLQAGDEVVTEGVQTLRDGADVTPAETRGAARSTGAQKETL